MTPSKLLTRAEVAEYLGVPEQTLAYWAYRGEGPPFAKIGRHARYRPDDVEAWRAAHVVGKQTVKKSARRKAAAKATRDAKP